MFIDPLRRLGGTGVRGVVKDARATRFSARGGWGDFCQVEGIGVAASTAHPSARNHARPSQAPPSRYMRWRRHHWGRL